jgi:hypothetical protein
MGDGRAHRQKSFTRGRGRNADGNRGAARHLHLHLQKEPLGFSGESSGVVFRRESSAVSSRLDRTGHQFVAIAEDMTV